MVHVPVHGGQDVDPPPQPNRQALHTVELVCCHAATGGSAACSSSDGAPHLLSLNMKTGVVSSLSWAPGEERDADHDDVMS